MLQTLPITIGLDEFSAPEVLTEEVDIPVFLQQGVLIANTENFFIVEDFGSYWLYRKWNTQPPTLLALIGNGEMVAEVAEVFNRARFEIASLTNCNPGV